MYACHEGYALWATVRHTIKLSEIWLCDIYSIMLHCMSWEHTVQFGSISSLISSLLFYWPSLRVMLLASDLFYWALALQHLGIQIVISHIFSKPRAPGRAFPWAIILIMYVAYTTRHHIFNHNHQKCMLWLAFTDSTGALCSAWFTMARCHYSCND